jgi:hypothetical protein
MTRPRTAITGGWTMSFLDLFTCALAGVFVLLILTTADPNRTPGDEPAGYFHITARFAVGPKVPPQLQLAERPDGIEFQGPDVLPGEKEQMVMVSGYIDPKATGTAPVVRLRLLSKPTAVDLVTEQGVVKLPSDVTGYIYKGARGLYELQLLKPGATK